MTVNTTNKFKCVSLASIVTLTISLTACDNVSKITDKVNEVAGGATNTGEVLTVLAGSELKDIEPFIADIQKNTGITLQVEYSGTLDGVDSILQGQEIDTAWFSHGKYLSLASSSNSGDIVKEQTPMMLSPVVMGVKHSKAQALGWLKSDGTVKSDITWENIANASQSGKLKYAMTNPSASNSGFTALMGVTSAFAGTSDAPTAEDVAKAKPKLKAFFRGQALTSGSSGWLAESFIKEQDKLDAIINYESVLMQMNANAQLKDKLTLIYPKEGIVTADYPFSLINSAKKASYDKVVAYLKTPEMQQKIMNQTNRRPVISSVKLDDKFHQGLLVELPFPNSQAVVDGILFDFANELRNPAYALFLLDVSGSMQGEGIEQLKKAMLGLTGQGINGSAKFTKFSDNEVVAIKPFSNVMYDAHSFTVSQTTLPQLRTDINSLKPYGGTAIYSALDNGYNWISSVKSADETTRQSNPKKKPHYYTIVLMTDGQNAEGIDFNTFKKNYEALPEGAKNIKVFTVLFGNADESEMTQIAELTGGRVFDGRKGNLSQVFKKIRGYQ